MECVNESLHGVRKTSLWFAVGRWEAQCQGVMAGKTKQHGHLSTWFCREFLHVMNPKIDPNLALGKP